MKSTTTKFRKVLILGAMLLGFFQSGRVDAQTPCVGQTPTDAGLHGATEVMSPM
jgi:hypothetical protein